MEIKNHPDAVLVASGWFLFITWSLGLHHAAFLNGLPKHLVCGAGKVVAELFQPACRPVH
ncbi:MAG: hypothetical protein IJR06_01845 [Paludibacteraceae bacterium]|nr:hypothetical protein [Paludibacteraceae bacterium]